MRTYRDYLARRGYAEPLVIERTPKFGGDLVLASSCAPVQRVPSRVRPRGIGGRFVSRAGGGSHAG